VTSSGQTCNTFYTQWLLFPQAKADALCADSTFGWNNDPKLGYFETALALLSCYFYGTNFNVANKNYITTFLAITQWQQFQITNNLQSANSTATYMVYNIISPPIYNHYSTQLGGNVCGNNLGNQMCTFNNLTYNQFDNGTPLLNPLPGMAEVDAIDSSYIIYYQGYSILSYPLESWYYGARSTQGIPHEVAIAEMYYGAQINGLFTSKIVADLLLNYDDVGTWESNFVGVGTPNYLKYVALNFGLGGMFTYKTPRSFIEGYTDPLLTNMQMLPVIWGGDATINT